MSANATIDRRIMDDEHVEITEELENYLRSLSPVELRELASYARKMAAGMENKQRIPGTEGGSWLEAQYVRGSGPYFYQRTYYPADYSYLDNSGKTKSGRTRLKYVGRRLPPDVAEEFGYPEGVTPEETDVSIIGTPRHGSSRKKSSE